MISQLNIGSSVSSLGAWGEMRQSQSAAASASPGNDFGSVLKSFATQAVDTMKQGEAAAVQGITGQMPVQQVVDQVMAAERTLQATLAVRDKLVAAFQEITRMQI